jgi:Domain of Unknown Function with PDB structure (DUF3857)/Transglutaminase-like superfamily
MNSKLCCNPPRPPAASKLLAICFLAAAGTFLPALRLHAADTPDWLRAAAQQTLPDYPKETSAVIVLDEQIITVKRPEEIEVLQRRAIRILRPKGKDEYGVVAVPTSNDLKLTYLKAWCIPAKGDPYEVKEKEAVEVGFNAEELYGDVHTKMLRIPAADPGSVVGFEFVLKQRPYFLQDQWNFQHFAPLLRGRFTLHLPASWEYDVKWGNHPPVEPRSDGQNSFTWEVANVPGIEDERGMPPFRSIAGRLAVQYFPPGGSGKAGSTWQAVGAWDDQLNLGRSEATPEIRAKVGELTAGKTATLDKIRALAEFAQSQIRYVAIEIGIGGYQPHMAGEVFSHRYGDCKDKANLLRTMLGVIGVEAYPVLVNTERGSVLPDFPAAMSFDHAITAMRLPPDVPEGDMFSVVETPKLGRLLIFDPTNAYVPLGYLPYYEQDSYGLLVTSAGGDLLRLPALASASNRLSRMGKFTLEIDGTLTGEVDEIRRGAEAAEKRRELLEIAPADRGKTLEKFLALFLSNFTLTKATISNLEKNDELLQIHYEFTARGYAKNAGGLLLLRPAVLGRKASSVAEKERKYPVDLDTQSVQTDLFEIKLPPGYVVDDLPAAASVSYDFGRYTSETKVEENVLKYKRLFETKKITVPLDQVPDLKVFYHKIAADEGGTAVLKYGGH